MTKADADPLSEIARPLWFAATAVALFIAFVAVWATGSQLSTTIRLNGNIVSSGSSIELQHPHGGLIKHVHIERHDAVRKDQKLFEFDVALERENLKAYLELESQLKAENTVISALLDNRLDHLTDKELTLGRRFILRFEQAELRQKLSKEATESLGLQVEAQLQKIHQHDLQIEQLTSRLERQTVLVKEGILSRDTSEAQRERVMIISAERAGEEAKQIALLDQKAQQLKQGRLIWLSFIEELSRTESSNEKQLKELKITIAQLRDRIAFAEITAPVDGVITELVFEAPGMFAAKGQTMVTITPPLSRPYLRFFVPPHNIDQVHAGSEGRFTLLAVNQRDLPRLSLNVTAVAPRAKLDENDNPLAYEGRAEIARSSEEAIAKALKGPSRLSEDMPVELLIEGRKLSPAQYFFEPLTAAFGRALQD